MMRKRGPVGEKTEMNVLRKRWGWTAMTALVLAVLTGCTSSRGMVAACPPAKAQKIAHVEARCSGAHLLCVPPAYVIPIGWNTCTKRAYQKALAQAPGATALTDVSIQENWFWFLFGTMRTVTVSGEAVK